MELQTFTEPLWRKQSTFRLFTNGIWKEDKAPKWKDGFRLPSFLFLDLMAWLMGLLLHSIGWKRRILHKNLEFVGIRNFKTLWFYQNLCRDLLVFLLEFKNLPIQTNPRDSKKWKHFRSEGGLLLTAHYHNWEVMGAWLSKNEFPVLSVAKKLKNKFWNNLLQFRRGRQGRLDLYHFERKQLADWLQEKKIVAFLWDQADGNRYSKSNFFSKNVLHSRIPELLRSKNPVPVYFLYLSPRFEIRIHQLEKKGALGPNLGLKYHRMLERLIRKQPEYWYGWVHRRWKGTLSYHH